MEELFSGRRKCFDESAPNDVGRLSPLRPLVKSLLVLPQLADFSLGSRRARGFHLTFLIVSQSMTYCVPAPTPHRSSTRRRALR